MSPKRKPEVDLAAILKIAKTS